MITVDIGNASDRSSEHAIGNSSEHASGSASEHANASLLQSSQSLRSSSQNARKNSSSLCFCKSCSTSETNHNPLRKQRWQVGGWLIASPSALIIASVESTATLTIARTTKTAVASLATDAASAVVANMRNSLLALCSLSWYPLRSCETLAFLNRFSPKGSKHLCKRLRACNNDHRNVVA